MRESELDSKSEIQAGITSTISMKWLEASTMLGEISSERWLFTHETEADSCRNHCPRGMQCDN